MLEGLRVNKLTKATVNKQAASYLETDEPLKNIIVSNTKQCWLVFNQNLLELKIYRPVESVRDDIQSNQRKKEIEWAKTKKEGKQTSDLGEGLFDQCKVLSLHIWFYDEKSGWLPALWTQSMDESFVSV